MDVDCHRLSVSTQLGVTCCDIKTGWNVQLEDIDTWKVWTNQQIAEGDDICVDGLRKKPSDTLDVSVDSCAFARTSLRTSPGPPQDLPQELTVCAQSAVLDLPRSSPGLAQASRSGIAELPKSRVPRRSPGASLSMLKGIFDPSPAVFRERPSRPGVPQELLMHCPGLQQELLWSPPPSACLVLLCRSPPTVRLIRA